MPDTRRMTHANDPEASWLAAQKLLPHLNALQERVLEAVRRIHRTTGGGVTDGELEALDEFAAYAYSTVRKRRTELLQAGYIRASTGEPRNGFTIWIPVPVGELIEQKQRQAAQEQGCLF